MMWSSPNTAADRINKSWFVQKDVIPFIILVNILSFHPNIVKVWGNHPVPLDFNHNTKQRKDTALLSTYVSFLDCVRVNLTLHLKGGGRALQHSNRVLNAHFKTCWVVFK